MNIDGSQASSAGPTRSFPTFRLQPAVSTPPPPVAPGASAHALAAEVAARAAHFAATGEGASIDLRCLKAMPEERDILASLLGKGEVSITVDALGHSEIQETQISCVWWVRHRNTAAETVGELIEIADVPEVATGDRGAVASGLVALRARLPPMAATADAATAPLSSTRGTRHEQATTAI